MNNIGVSILVLAYNHEKYIAKAIEGFLMQKTSFPIEIIINEDKSTDRTAEIIRSYEEKYPEIIKPIYHTENQYSKGVNINAEFMLPKASGKYIALCDGDDFWTDETKLQRQYDALEANPDCYMCLHKVYDKYENTSDPKRRYIPSTPLKEGKLTTREFYAFEGNGGFFNEVCYFFNAEKYREYQNNYPEFAQAFMKNKTDDAPMLLYFASIGNVYYIDRDMATYRRFTEGSWSDSLKKANDAQFMQYCKNVVAAYEEFHKFTGNQYRKEFLYSNSYFRFKLLECQQDYKKMASPKYEIVLCRQSANYQKRVRLMAKNQYLFGAVFAVYDKLRSRKQ